MPSGGSKLRNEAALVSSEWLTAIATLGTFVVIAASAIAALLQLRHMRGSNQIIALTEVRETIESAEFQAALRYVREDFQVLLRDPARRKSLMISRTPPPEFEPVRTVANFFESTGALIKRGIIDSDIACDLWGYVVWNHWNDLADFIGNIRIARSAPALFENFEYWAVLSEAFRETHPQGDYPRKVRRMPAPEVWPESLEAKRAAGAGPS